MRFEKLKRCNKKERAILCKKKLDDLERESGSAPGALFPRPFGAGMEGPRVGTQQP